AAGHEHRGAGPVARIARSFDDARQVDTAHQRVAAQDLAGPGRRERVLVVDVGVADPDHDLPGGEVIERDGLEAGGNPAPFGMNAQRLESGSHARTAPASLDPEARADPNSVPRWRQARASVPAEALEPHHETLGV